MSLKVLIILCLGFLAVQGKAQEEARLEGAFDVVIEILKKLEEDIESAVVNAIKTIGEGLEAARNIINDIIAEFSDQAKNIITPLIDEIKDLEEQAVQIGVDVTSCIGDSIEEITALPGDMIGSITDCLEDQFQQAEEYVDDVIAEVNATFKDIESYWDKIDECEHKSILEQPLCIAELVAEISADAISMPITIASLIKKAMDYVITLPPELTFCSAGKITELAQTAGGIVGDVTTCCFEKFNNHTSEAPSSSSSTSETTTPEDCTTLEYDY